MPGKDHFLKRIVRVSGEEFKLVMVCFIFSSSSSGSSLFTFQSSKFASSSISNRPPQVACNDD